MITVITAVHMNKDRDKLKRVKGSRRRDTRDTWGRDKIVITTARRREYDNLSREISNQKNVYTDA